MKRRMTIEYLKCRADLNFEVYFRVNGYDQVGSYFIRIMDHFYFKNTHDIPLNVYMKWVFTSM